MNKNQDQELDYRMEAENASDARLTQVFGEALGDEPSKEETLAAWGSLREEASFFWEGTITEGRR